MNKLRFAISLLLVIVLQNTVFSRIVFFGVSPSLTIAYLVALSILYGPIWGGYTGLGLGLLEDIMFADILGVRALLFFVCASIIGRLLYHNDSNYATGTFLTAIFAMVVLVGHPILLIPFQSAPPFRYLFGVAIPMFGLLSALLYLPVLFLMRRWMAPKRARRFQAF